MGLRILKRMLTQVSGVVPVYAMKKYVGVVV
jgi:hypothetical protein